MVDLIKVSHLVPFPHNARKRNTKKDVADLAANIKELAGDGEIHDGVIQPLIVRSTSARTFEVVCGSRRLAALDSLKADRAPCVVRELTDEQAITVSAIENLQREDLHPIEEADAYKHMMEGAGMDVKEIAAIAGRDPSHVYKRLRLNELAPAITKAFWTGKHDDDITPAHFIEIAKLPTHELQLRAWQVINDENGYERTISELRYWITQSGSNRLSAATFTEAAKLPVLNGKEGETHPTCKGCPKRSDDKIQGQLFEGVFHKQDGAQCLDPQCWDRKTAAQIQVRLDEGIAGIDDKERWQGNERYIPESAAPDKAPKEKVMILGGFDNGKIVEMVPRDAVDPKKVASWAGGEEGKSAATDSSGQRKVYKQEKEDIDEAMAILVGAMESFSRPQGELVFHGLRAVCNQAVLKLVGKRTATEVERYGYGNFTLPKNPKEFHDLVWNLVLAAHCEPYGDLRQSFKAMHDLVKKRNLLNAEQKKAFNALYGTWFDGAGRARPNGRDRYKERNKAAV